MFAWTKDKLTTDDVEPKSKISSRSIAGAPDDRKSKWRMEITDAVTFCLAKDVVAEVSTPEGP